MTVDVGHMQSVVRQLLERQRAEKIDRLFRRPPNFRRAALSSASLIAIRARDMVKTAGLP